MSKNELKVFSNAEFGEVRTVVVNGEPWFVGKDVAEALGYSNTRDALITHVEEEDKNTVVISDGKRGNPNQTIINESGVYSLVFGSKLPDAKKFKRWVTSEVLPTIRKTGGYINNSEMLVNTYFDDLPEGQRTIIKGLFQNIENKQRKIVALDKENDLLAERALQWADRPLINALVRAYGHSLDGDYSAAWREFKKELLYRHSINLNARITRYLNETGKRTKPKTLDMLDDSELQRAISTAAALCRENDVDISDIISNKAS